MIDLEQVTRKAVIAALESLDNSTENRTSRPQGPCGDSLASSLHETILKALEQEYSRSK